MQLIFIRTLYFEAAKILIKCELYNIYIFVIVLLCYFAILLSWYLHYYSKKWGKNEENTE